MYTQPVKVGDEITVDIINMGEKGDGIAKHENFVIMVPGSEIDKKYSIRIKKVFKTFAISEVIEEV